MSELDVIDRRTVADALNRLAFAAELLDDDAVDAKACASVAWTVRSLEGDLTLPRVASLPDVSVPMLAVIDDVAHKRMPPLLAALERRVPQGLLEVRRLKGLGPKKIRALWIDLDVTSIGELEYACQENRLVELKGFGKKTQDSVQKQIEALREQAGLLRLDQALVVAEAVKALLSKPAFITGDLRRRTEVIAEVQLVTTESTLAVHTALTAFAQAHTAGDADDEHAAPEIAVTDSRLRVLVGKTQLDVLAAVSPRKLGTTLVMETGSAAHVALLRERALGKGLVLDDVEAPDEEALYAALGLVFVEPERREAGVPLVEVGKARPRLVRREDLLGSLHNHTTASDGTASMKQMRDAAFARGLTYFAITDHSQSAVYAKGLSSTTLADQRVEAAALNGDGSESARCVVVTGVESDILKDGTLDYPDAVLAALEIVIASVHSRFGQKGDDLTARMVAAAKNRFTDVVGHPTGRLLLGRAPSEYDVSALLEACESSGCAVELNANPARLDLNERHLAMAKERKLVVSIAADAHSVGAIDHLEYGVAIARRAGLTPEDVLNARPLPDVMAWLRQRRG